MLVQVARLVAVVALLGVAAAIATPRGRLPLALRGVMAVLRKDAAANGAVVTDRGGGTVSGAKRLLAFVLVLAAVLLALI